MKTKAFSKKLTLNKQTIVSLDQKELSTVKGGSTPSVGCTAGAICTAIIIETIEIADSVGNSCYFWCPEVPVIY